MAAVIQRGKKILIAQRAFEKRHGGLWEFPGGKTQTGETLEAAITREIYEEFGVRAESVAQPVHSVTDPGSQFSIAFMPVEIDGELLPTEHIEVRWIEKTELCNYDLAPADAIFARWWNIQEKA